MRNSHLYYETGHMFRILCNFCPLYFVDPKADEGPLGTTERLAREAAIDGIRCKLNGRGGGAEPIFFIGCAKGNVS